MRKSGFRPRKRTLLHRADGGPFTQEALVEAWKRDRKHGGSVPASRIPAA
ncbi:hypothetical protein OV320_7974 [Actinobacteria bacterium OV320]|nr:hypothetical protein OV320_7974 [Actinobacteria bacterium OV320]